MRSHTEAELKLFAAQAIEALKTEITNLITDKLASDNVKAAMQDQTFIQKIIVELVRNWSKNEKLTIGVQNSKDIENYIASNAKDILDKGLKIESVNGIKSGFTLSPEDGSYKVKFGEEEFIEYFKEFLRPQVQKSFISIIEVSDSHRLFRLIYYSKNHFPPWVSLHSSQAHS